MDYEKAYKEPLEKAKQGLPIDEVFLELKESEDERIRKTLLEYFNERNSYRDEDETFYGVPFPSIIAYLEKQKEYVSENFDCVWAIENCEELIDEGKKLSPRFKELLKDVCHAWYDKGIELGKKQKEQEKVISEIASTDFEKELARIIVEVVEMSNGGPSLKEYADRLLCIARKEIKPAEWWNKGYLEGRKNAHIPARELGLPSSWDFQKEQKSAEWSGLTDKNLAVETLRNVADALKEHNLYRGWQESLIDLAYDIEHMHIVQPAEWSEEDEKYFKACVRAMRTYGGCDTPISKWIEALKDRVVNC